MAATKLNPSQLNSVSVSTGSADASKPVITNSTGQIDISLLNNVYAFAIIMRS